MNAKWNEIVHFKIYFIIFYPVLHIFPHFLTSLIYETSHRDFSKCFNPTHFANLFTSTHSWENLDYICFYFPCFLTLSSTHPIWCMNEIKLHHLIVLHNVHRNNNCYYRKSRIYMCTHVQNEGNKMIRILISNNFHVPCLVFFPFMLFVMNFNEKNFLCWQEVSPIIRWAEKCAAISNDKFTSSLHMYMSLCIESNEQRLVD